MTEDTSQQQLELTLAKFRQQHGDYFFGRLGTVSPKDVAGVEGCIFEASLEGWAKFQQLLHYSPRTNNELANLHQWHLPVNYVIRPVLPLGPHSPEFRCLVIDGRPRLILDELDRGQLDQADLASIRQLLSSPPISNSLPFDNYVADLTKITGQWSIIELNMLLDGVTGLGPLKSVDVDSCPGDPRPGFLVELDYFLEQLPEQELIFLK